MKRIFFIFISILSLTPNLHAQPSVRDYAMTLPVKFHRAITTLYRKTSKEELETIKPSAEDTAKYADFLRQPDTGLTRLVPNLACVENTKVVVVTPNCLKYTMPGAGASYSFRVKDYRMPRLADLTFADNGFQTTGVLIHGILTKIGDIPLEDVNLQTKGLNFLTDFQPVADYEEAQKIAGELVKGVVKDEFVYRRGLNALENTTYVLRSIAYDGAFHRTVNGITYNELDFDKRRDATVAFRIVRKDADGSVTILWKKLEEKDSPKIKQKKK